MPPTKWPLVTTDGQAYKVGVAFIACSRLPAGAGGGKGVGRAPPAELGRDDG